MSAGVVRVVVLLCAVVAVTRAQVWYHHSGSWIKTAMAPLTHSNGKKWFGVGDNGKLYQRYQDSSGNWQWSNHGRPSWFRKYNSEPCVLEGENKLFLTTKSFFGNSYLYEHAATAWTPLNHGQPYSPGIISGCSSVHKPGFKARTFVQASDGELYERYWEWNSGWTWRGHGSPPSTTVANIKTVSFLWLTNGVSFVFVVGTDGNMWQRITSQNGGGNWVNRGRPAGKTISRIHGTRVGYWWAITTDGSVCWHQGGWPCFSLTNRRVLDCSDPFLVSGYRISMFCVTNNAIIQGSSGYGLYQLTVSGLSATATWVNHGVPPWFQCTVFISRPNVAFTSGNATWPVVQTPKSVFVTAIAGVFELRF